jgi:hypothetical protein
MNSFLETQPLRALVVADSPGLADLLCRLLEL